MSSARARRLLTVPEDKVADLLLEDETSTPRLRDFCEKCRPLAKRILDDFESRLAELKRLTEAPEW